MKTTTYMKFLTILGKSNIDSYSLKLIVKSLLEIIEESKE